jgi:hypothetical protein
MSSTVPLQFSISNMSTVHISGHIALYSQFTVVNLGVNVLLVLSHVCVSEEHKMMQVLQRPCVTRTGPAEQKRPTSIYVRTVNLQISK